MKSKHKTEANIEEKDWKKKLAYMIIVLIVFSIIFIAVLDPFNAVYPRISRECCDEFCNGLGLTCHRYTEGYIMCKSSFEDYNNNISLVADFYVENTQDVCYDAD